MLTLVKHHVRALPLIFSRKEDNTSGTLGDISSHLSKSKRLTLMFSWPYSFFDFLGIRKIPTLSEFSFAFLNDNQVLLLQEYLAL